MYRDLFPVPRLLQLSPLTENLQLLFSAWPGPISTQWPLSSSYVGYRVPALTANLVHLYYELPVRFPATELLPAFLWARNQQTMDVNMY